MKAFLNVKARQNYKRDDLVEGVRRLGYELLGERSQLPMEEDSLLVTWNLHAIEGMAQQLRHHGGRVIVVENPYIKYDKDKNEYLAMQRDGHNGSGLVPSGGTERLERLGLKFEDWKPAGQHVLVADQRGIGSTSMRSPFSWGKKEVDRLRKFTGRPIILRPHPGRVTPGQVLPSLDEQMSGAHAVVVWASNVATTALLKGIPVFYEAPHITLAQAAKRGVSDVENPWKGDRIPAFSRLSWSQWSLPEVRSGEAFKRLLECTYTAPRTCSPPESAPSLQQG